MQKKKSGKMFYLLLLNDQFTVRKLQTKCEKQLLVVINSNYFDLNICAYTEIFLWNNYCSLRSVQIIFNSFLLHWIK